MRDLDRGLRGSRCIALWRSAFARVADDNDEEEARDDSSGDLEIEGARDWRSVELSESSDRTLWERSHNDQQPRCFAIHIDKAFALFRAPARLLSHDAGEPGPSRGID